MTFFESNIQWYLNTERGSGELYRNECFHYQIFLFFCIRALKHPQNGGSLSTSKYHPCIFLGGILQANLAHAL